MGAGGVGRGGSEGAAGGAARCRRTAPGTSHGVYAVRDTGGVSVLPLLALQAGAEAGGGGWGTVLGEF